MIRAVAGVVAALLVLWAASRGAEVGDHWQHIDQTPGEVLKLAGACVLAAVLTWVAIRPKGGRQ